MTKDSKQNKKPSVKRSPSTEELMSQFIDDFAGRWNKLDREFDKMSKETKRIRELNGKATNHEIDL